MRSRYHNGMKLRALVLALGVSLCFDPARLSAADGLPDLGETAQVDLSPATERRIGSSVMLEIRRDPAWLDDPEVYAYLNRLGARLSGQLEGSRQEFELFALKDPTLNAFAMPGGFIGVHTGLILASESESELASVLAHEISHVTQRHLARIMNKSGQGQVSSLVSLAIAILAARSNPDLAMGAAMTGQAASIQNQLNYTREFEREADRIGLTLLERSGFDIRGMSSFFERLQRFGRLYENNAPGYLRTHPLTTERIADLGNRIEGRPYRQVADTLEFQLVRAKLRSQQGNSRDAVTEFESRLKDRKFAGNEISVRYGLAQALLRDGKVAAAEREILAIQRIKPAVSGSPMIDTLAANLRLQQGDAPAAVKILRAAQLRYPQERAVVYGLVESLRAANAVDEALKVATDDLAIYTSDATMHRLQAMLLAQSGQRLQQHRALAEAYALEGLLPAAVEQLQLAQKAGDGNFYEQSQVDARLREFRKRLDDEAKLKNSP